MKFVSHGWKCSFRCLALEKSITLSVRTSPVPTRFPAFHCPRLHVTSTGFRSNLSCGIRVLCNSSPIVASSLRDLPASFSVTPSRSFSPLLTPNYEMDPDESGNLQSEHPPSEVPRGFQIVVAATKEHGIGKQGTLPWKLPTDMRFFKTVTSSTTASSKRNAVIMGRNTWESIPEKFRPLPGRLNVILTRNGIITPTPPKGVLVSKSFGDALAVLAREPYEEQVESVFVIGGGQVYRFGLKLFPYLLNRVCIYT